jgi:hypothetical protein
MENRGMTETNFWDMFNKKHNPRYYYAKKKNKEKIQEKNKKQENYPAESKDSREQD